MTTKIGWRTIKSAIAVFISLALFSDNAFFACITSVLCLEDTVSHSISAGKDRILSTVVGAVVGMIFLSICRFINSLDLVYFNDILVYACISFGIVVVIHCCNQFKSITLIGVACVVFIAITTTHAHAEPFAYAITRLIETVCGIFIAIGVNFFIRPNVSSKS